MRSPSGLKATLNTYQLCPVSGSPICRPVATCSCGNTFETRSTKDVIKLEDRLGYILEPPLDWLLEPDWLLDICCMVSLILLSY